MAIKKNEERQALPFEERDPAVDLAMGEDPLYGKMAKQRARARNMTPAKRRQAERDAKRNKITYDLPAGITEKVAQLAQEHECPPSHVVAVLLWYGLRSVEAEEIDLDQHRVISNIPRYEWFLRVEEDE